MKFLLAGYAHLYQFNSFCSVAKFRAIILKFTFLPAVTAFHSKNSLSLSVILIPFTPKHGNVLSLLSSVPVTHQAPREMEETRNQEPENFQVECAVCLTDRTIFKKMHHSWSTETGHYVCLECFWSWNYPAPRIGLTCPIVNNSRALSVGWTTAIPWACRSTWLVSDAEPSVNRNDTWPTGVPTWPKTIPDVPFAGNASRELRNVPSVD